MPTIDKESVRMLAIQIGCKDAAKQLGLSYDRVRQWSSRYKWFAKHNPPTHPPVTPVTMPSDVLGNLGKETKLSFAKSMHRMAKDSELATLKDSGYVKNAIQGAAIVHGWNNDASKSNSILNLGILIGNTNPEKVSEESNKPVIDVDLE